jgi:hypothetical protein
MVGNEDGSLQLVETSVVINECDYDLRSWEVVVQLVQVVALERAALLLFQIEKFQIHFPNQRVVNARDPV